MYDPTPPPFGDLTRRWTQLTDSQRDQHVRRLLGVCCAEGHPAHVDRPGLDEGRCYRGLVPAAVAGDEVAIAWLATSHRPLLVARGHALLAHDPSEWGAACLEVLHTTLAKADTSEGRWLRRRVAQELTSRLSRVVSQHLARRRREYPTPPRVLHHTARPWYGQGWDPHPELTFAVDCALERLDAPTREALVALANQDPLAEIAARHGLSHAAVRQRVTRARKRLQPQLAGFRRTVA